ncbi:MAG: hypothetical protein GKS01_01825 [Alphaproteobacteria bacterium]|nr:hypothetical protein [Alphaproteobacteria bacterium]
MKFFVDLRNRIVKPLKGMKPKHWAITILGGIVVLVFGYAAILLYLSWPIAFGNVDKAGVFGDSFGILTSLFSGLAFAGIVFTIFQQSEELKLQREDLRAQREELQLSRAELKNQVDAINHQGFENTFFQMLALHNDILNAIDVGSVPEGDATGRDCFVTFYKRLRHEYGHVKNTKPTDRENEIIELAYGEFWKRYQTDLGHYFRFLYTIFKFVKESEVEDQRQYTNILRAQLSDDELLVLFYNCISEYGVEKFKPLAEEFTLFNNLPKQRLCQPEHKNLYKPSAFE